MDVMMNRVVMDMVVRCNKSFKLITISACYDYKSGFCRRL